LEYFTYRHLGYFMTIWNILCTFGTFFIPILLSCTKKNLATLLWPVKRFILCNALKAKR
jgi:hypothetical protein